MPWSDRSINTFTGVGHYIVAQIYGIYSIGNLASLVLRNNLNYTSAQCVGVVFAESVFAWA